MEICPVCLYKNPDPILTLFHQPVFQHPVSLPHQIPPPYFQDLNYFFCRQCGHLFQKVADRTVLERIYKEFYYTPRPSNIGITFQQDFMDALDACIDLADMYAVLEIGCSAGEMLKIFDSRYPGRFLSGVEPNQKTARQAGKSGFTVFQDFFTEEAAQRIPRQFDLVFHRNVVEHIWDFDDFFAAHDRVCHRDTVLAVETPCLDWSAEHRSLAAFHLEHVHLFSIHSLKKLQERFGWYLSDWRVTQAGYLIAFFDRHYRRTMVPKLDPPVHLQSWIDKTRFEIEHEVKGKRLALWGAGSGGIKLINYFNLCPEVILDANPVKAGKMFVGYENLIIEEAFEWFEKMKDSSSSWVMVVASTYFKEIAGSLKKVGWKGTVISPWAV